MATPLVDLHPRWLAYDSPSQRHYVDTLAEADCLQFDCPTCGTAHVLLCWFSGVPQSRRLNRERWTVTGTGAADLTLAPDPAPPQGFTAPIRSRPCGWEGNITGGSVVAVGEE